MKLSGGTFPEETISNKQKKKLFDSSLAIKIQRSLLKAHNLSLLCSVFVDGKAPDTACATAIVTVAVKLFIF